MGNLLSKAKTLRLAIKFLLEADKNFQAILKRASAPPGLPVSNPSPSYWLEDPPHPELVHARSPELPERADVVIIGSGITGAAVARSLLLHASSRSSITARPGGHDNVGLGSDSYLGGGGLGGEEGKKTGARIPRVVILEARSLCSGATGRNGGHMKSSPHELFEQLKKTYGPERAAAITRFQLAHVKALTELCEAEGWHAAECREVETTDMYLDEEARDDAFEKVAELRRWLPELEVEILDASAARKKFETNQYIVGAIAYPAGAVWPYRLVSSVFRDLLDRFGDSLSLETDTAVTDIKSLSEGDSAYEVITSRGVIKCDQIVHATNSFSSQLIPGFRGKLCGFVAHMSAQRPGKHFPDYDGARSWSVVYGKAYDYVTQRPTVDGVIGDVMLGGGFDRGRNNGMDAIGCWDDSTEVIDPLVVNHIGNIFPTVFGSTWGQDQEEGRIKSVWTGIVAATGDTLPFVGRLGSQVTGRRSGDLGSEKGRLAGEWVAAGYNGDGMVWAWLSGTALGIMLLGAEDETLPQIPGRPGGKVRDWLPHELSPTMKRLKSADLSNLADRLS